MDREYMHLDNISPSIHRGSHMPYSRDTSLWNNYRHYDRRDQAPWNQPSQHSSRYSDKDGDDDIKKKTFCGLVSRFAGKTSMQGIPYINAARLGYAKLLWTLLTLAALGLSIAHMYILISLYYEYEKKTQISLTFNPLIMPAVTLCNTNRVRLSKITSTSTEIREFIDQLDSEVLKTTTSTKVKREAKSLKKVKKENVKKQKKFQPTKSRKREEDLGPESESSAVKAEFKYLYTDMSRELRFAVGHQMEDMLVSCSFRGRECSPEQFIASQSNDYGNCFTIQSDKYIAEQSGPDDGLSLVMFLENQEAIDAVSHGIGLRLVLHDTDTLSFPSREGLFISSNTETNIGLRLVDISRMGEPYGVCVDPNSLMQKYGIMYTRQACQSFCQQESVIGTCGCYNKLDDDVTAKMNVTSKKCETDEELICMYAIQDQFFTGQKKCTCENPCEERVYSKTLSTRQWPRSTYAKVLVDGVCELENGTSSTACDYLETKSGDNTELAQNFVKLNIYFEDLNYEQVKEVQDYEDVQFLSDVGGAIGLWIGLSILSMCELLQLFVELAQFGLYKCCGVNCTASSNANKNDRDKSIKDSNHSDDRPRRYRKQGSQDRPFSRSLSAF